MCLSWQARYSGVAPEPSVFGSFTSAPPLSSAATSAARPCRTPSISGVSPMGRMQSFESEGGVAPAPAPEKPLRHLGPSVAGTVISVVSEEALEEDQGLKM